MQKKIQPAMPKPQTRYVLRFAFLALLAGILSTLASLNEPRAAAQEGAILLEVDGAIGPATAAYIEGGLEEASARGASLVVLRMDTPGGMAVLTSCFLNPRNDGPHEIRLP